MIKPLTAAEIEHVRDHAEEMALRGHVKDADWCALCERAFIASEGHAEDCLLREEPKT